MEMVAASKLQKAQDATFASRIYASSAREVLCQLKLMSKAEHVFFNAGKNTSSLYIVFTSDRGLAGAYSAKVLKELFRAVGSATDAKIIMIGKRGMQLLARLRHGFEILGAYPSADISPIAQTAMKLFIEGAIGQVVIVYTDFESISRQRTTSRSILPIPAEEIFDSGIQKGNDVLIEPSAQVLVDYIVPRFVAVQLYQANLEAAASEHASRMFAMHTASDNASDIIDSLTLEYNSARQAGITAQLAEIAAGAQAVL